MRGIERGDGRLGEVGELGELRELRGGFARGAAEACLWTALFVAGGLAWAAWLGAAGSAGAPTRYLLPMSPEEAAAPEEPSVWLVDGYNVLNVGLLAGRSREGWWSSGFRRELLGRVEAFEDVAAELWVVFDGSQPAGAEPVGRVRSVFAPSADAWLLSELSRRAPGDVALVTADRRLAERARRRGARIVAPAAFLARCPAPAGEVDAYSAST